jgi:hypothetical protein
MNLQPLRELLHKHRLQVDATHSVLDITAQLGQLSRVLLKATQYGSVPLKGFVAPEGSSSPSEPLALPPPQGPPPATAQGWQQGASAREARLVPQAHSLQALQDAVGDLLFAVAHLALVLEVEPEQALHASIARCDRALDQRAQASQPTASSPSSLGPSSPSSPSSSD